MNDCPKLLSATNQRMGNLYCLKNSSARCIKVFFIADKVKTEAPQNPSRLGEEIEGYVLPENFAGNFYPN